MVGGRSLALMLVAVVMALAGVTAGYVNVELAEPDAFADHAVEALRAPEVREAIAEQAAVEIVERGAPDLVASRPLVLGAVEAVLETEAFGRVLRGAAISAHRVLLSGDRDVVVELEEARDVLVPAVENVSPGIARQIPADVSPRIAEIRRGDAATWVLRVAESANVPGHPAAARGARGAGLAVGARRTAARPGHRRRRRRRRRRRGIGRGRRPARPGHLAQRADRRALRGALARGRRRGVGRVRGGLSSWLTVMAMVGPGGRGGRRARRVPRRPGGGAARPADVVAGGRLPRGRARAARLSR
jgi:hypothetical protein